MLWGFFCCCFENATLSVLCCAWSHLTLCDPVDYSLPGSSVHGDSPGKSIEVGGKKKYWSGLPCPPPGDLPNPRIKPRSPVLQADSLLTEPPRKPKNTGVGILSLAHYLHKANRNRKGDVYIWGKFIEEACVWVAEARPKNLMGRESTCSWGEEFWSSSLFLIDFIIPCPLSRPPFIFNVINYFSKLKQCR